MSSVKLRTPKVMLARMDCQPDNSLNSVKKARKGRNRRATEIPRPENMARRNQRQKTLKKNIPYYRTGRKWKRET